MSGSFVQPGVTYPREVDGPDGLPKGWKAIEFAYKSGPCLGKTYVRYNSPVKREMCSTVKKALERDALNKGLTQEQANAIVEEYTLEQERKKQRLKAEKEAQGFLKGEAREQAISAFRSVHGPLSGGLVGKLPGWRAESIFRETCGQTAVTYYNPEGRAFCTLKDIECYFGVRIQRGEVCSEIDEAQLNVKTDDKGRVVNEARQEVAQTRTVADVLEMQEKKKQKLNETIALGAEQVRVSKMLIPAERYTELASFAVLDVGPGPEVKVEDTLVQQANVIRKKLQGAGFLASTELLAVQGSPSGLPHIGSLRGIFHARPGEFQGKPYFQKTLVHSSGVLACIGIYIYWSSGQERWKIGTLDDADRKAPYAFLKGTRERPCGVHSEKWHVLIPSPSTS